MVVYTYNPSTQEALAQFCGKPGYIVRPYVNKQAKTKTTVSWGTGLKTEDCIGPEKYSPKDSTYFYKGTEERAKCLMFRNWETSLGHIYPSKGSETN
jgi:hypothetical protein